MIRLGVTMRAIYIEDGLSITFPGRDQEFDQGVEIGIAIALMAAGQNFTILFSNETIEQAKELAEKMNFHLIVIRTLEETAQVAFRAGKRPSYLTLVASQTTRA
jgi:hypothetical protein